jgi:hypothetical protein
MILAQKPSFTKKKYKKEDKELGMEADYWHSEYTKGGTVFVFKRIQIFPQFGVTGHENDHDEQHQATMMNATDLLQGNVTRT